MHVRSLGLVAMVSFLISGCAAVDSFENRADSVNRSYSAARNSEILLNIARARYEHPLSFTAISSVSAGSSLGGNMGLPTVTFGPGQVVSQKQAVFGNNSLNGNVSGSIQVNPLDSKEFTEGLLAPVGLGTVQTLIWQGFPNDLIYLLLVESIQVSAQGGAMVRIVNDPRHPSYPEFERFLAQAVGHGLSIEVPTSKTHARLCFDRTIATLPTTQLKPICGSLDADGVRGVVDPRFGAASVAVNTRSTHGVFRYLGVLSDPAWNARVRASTAPNLATSSEDTRLLPLDKGPDCVARVQYLGDELCISAKRNPNGGRVLQILAQLLALSTSVRNLPAVQTIRVVE